MECDSTINNSSAVTANPPRDLISAFVITFNEADRIADCLNSLEFCDEIVVIDSFSTDATVQIAESLGAKVIQRPWPGYREQKAFGLRSVTHDWVLNVDADERVSIELQQSILAVLENSAKHRRSSQQPFEIEGYYINRVVFYLGRWWRLGGWYPEYRLRLFQKSKVTWGGVDPHERPEVSGPTERIEGELQHLTYRNMADQFIRLQAHSTIAAREEFALGKRFSLLKLLFNPFVRSIKFYMFKKGYREGVAGVIVAIAEGYYTFMKYAKLWECEFLQKHEAQSTSSAKDRIKKAA